MLQSNEDKMINPLTKGKREDFDVANKADVQADLIMAYDNFSKAYDNFSKAYDNFSRSSTVQADLIMAYDNFSKAYDNFSKAYDNFSKKIVKM